jgi:hypothetical protein
MNCFVTLAVLRSQEKKSYEVNVDIAETWAVVLEILPDSKSEKILANPK